jgi:hypothetical protein
MKNQGAIESLGRREQGAVQLSNGPGYDHRETGHATSFIERANRIHEIMRG